MQHRNWQVVISEEAYGRAEHDRDHVHVDVIDQASWYGLPRQIAHGEGYVAAVRRKLTVACGRA